MVRHPMTEQLGRFEAVASHLERVLPGAVSRAGHRQRIVIGVYDVVFVAGRTNMGPKAVAAMLPGNERVRRRYGSRLLLFRNVIAAKVTPILKPIADRVLAASQAALVREDAFFAHTLLHEMAHALAAPADVARSAGGSDAEEAGEDDAPEVLADQRLGERYSTIEECRADLVALVFLDLLERRGLFAPAMSEAATVTFIAGNLRTLRFGAENDYGRAAAIVLSSLLADRSLTQDTDGQLVIDIPKARRCLDALATRVQAIATTGDYDAAGALIDRRGSLPAEIRLLLPRLDDIPVDLAFVFDESFRTR
jgi:hypothetical protein